MGKKQHLAWEVMLLSSQALWMSLLTIYFLQHHCFTFMWGIDVLDACVARYKYHMRSHRWYLQMFWQTDMLGSVSAVLKNKTKHECVLCGPIGLLYLLHNVSVRIIGSGFLCYTHFNVKTALQTSKNCFRLEAGQEKHKWSLSQKSHEANDLWLYFPLFPSSMHPSVILTPFPVTGHRGARTKSSCHWARGGVQPGQVALLSQGWNIERNHSNSHSHVLTIQSSFGTTGLTITAPSLTLHQMLY